MKKRAVVKMGACPSRLTAGRGPKEDVRLPGTKLNFTPEQLARLNLHLIAQEVESAEAEEDAVEDRRRAELVDAVVERLVQRLVCGVGLIDGRFACKFLATFDAVGHRRPGKQRHKYLVRLDDLSAPSHYDRPQPSIRVVEGLGGDGTPQGYAKIRVQGEGADEWAEFVSQGGFLRRDKIQERFVELLALSAANSPDSPDHVDETQYCASPGKVVDVGVLQHILDIPPEEHVFFGSAEADRMRFPDPRDFRIAIVEASPEIRLRVGCLSPRLEGGGNDADREVKLVLGVACVGWPESSDFPRRISLGHVDCLLHQQAAQTGFYLVPDSPHPSIRCEDRAATWAIWMPAAELCLLAHYSLDSVALRAMSAVGEVVKRLGNEGRRKAFGGEQRGIQATSRHMVQTTTLFRLETESRDPLTSWAPDTLSRHIVETLDALSASLRTQRQRSYFFPGCDVVLAAGKGMRVLGEEDYVADAELLDDLIRRLHEASLSLLPDVDVDDAPVQAHRETSRLETTLLRKWTGVLKGLTPPPTTRSTRLCFLNSPTELGYTAAAASQYSSRQLDYIGHLFREMLKVRQLMIQNQPSPWLQPNVIGNPREDAVEDLVYLLTVILDQAKDIALKNAANLKGPKSSRRQRVDSVAKFKLQFETAILFLVDSVRKDADCAAVDFGDDLVLVRHVLRWLYRALDEDRRNFGPVLRPYLNSLFVASHDNCWHLEEFRKRQNLLKLNGNLNELRALGDFCKLVVGKKMDADAAILDAEPKKWLWARNMSDVAEFLHVKSKMYGRDIEGSLGQGLALVFPAVFGNTARELVNLPVNFGFERSVSIRSRFSTMSSHVRNGEVTVMTLKKNSTLGRGQTGYTSKRVATHDDLVLRLRHAFYTSCPGSRPGPTGLRPTPPPPAWLRPSAPPHARLRDASPMTLAIDAGRRYGQHRGVGDVVVALVNLQKFSVLQEVSSLLPDDHRVQILDVIQKLSKETRRVSALRKLRQPAAQKPRSTALSRSAKLSSKITPLQIYRPQSELSAISPPTKEQSDLIAEREIELEKELRKLKEESLLGTVRATRSQSTRPTVFGQEGMFENRSMLPMEYRYQVDVGTRSLAFRHQSDESSRSFPYRYGESEGTMSLGYKYGETEGRLYRCEEDAGRSVALLELTEDRQLRLGPTSFIRNDRVGETRKNDVITKL